MMEHSLLQKLAQSVARVTKLSRFSQNFSGFITESPTSGQPTPGMVGYPTSVEQRKSLKPTFGWFYNKTFDQSLFFADIKIISGLLQLPKPAVKLHFPAWPCHKPLDT